ncbi:MAG: cysteine--tRNA ligase [Candidatus Omnitrophica bacterium]|jgi:cysteinyl-tRNA synthetase|nr:cysteine--tRNA ligase [Candidatus Omnitrophota bacterium]
MSIFIYNSLSRKKEEFVSLEPQKINMYVCGPTVYDEPHIGHARSAYIFDVIRRYLAFKGYRVKFVRNVTDVDDKIIDKARKEFPGQDLNRAFKDVAEKYLASYHEALINLGIGVDQEEISEPKASEYIPKMIKFIQGLIDNGAAYVAGPDVYFDITKAKNYGKLSNQSLEKMESGARVALNENKRNPLDFALWKGAKENEPSWESPWGKGRPGWHIECSVMSSDILGGEFDIHGGGIDLIFPHHENEIAQSEGAGNKFARYWIHHGLLTIDGQKMSKSLGNFITVKDFLDKYKNADLLKLLFLSTHYSHPVDYTDEKIREARQALERISILRDKLDKPSTGNQVVKVPKELEDIKDKFTKAMDDDFNTPQALAAIFDLVNIANKNINDPDFSCHSGLILKELADIFGLSLEKETGSKELQVDVNTLIAQRNEARKKKDFQRSDEIRKELEAKGIILEDTKDGTTWRRKL